MKVTKYSMLLNEDRTPELVKEQSTYLKGVEHADTSAVNAEILCRLFHADRQPEEHLWLIALDNKAHLLGVFETGHGLCNASLVSPREIFMRLCLCGAVQFIVAHNHPSGDCTPSKEDIATTDMLLKAGRMMNIQLADHLIIGNGSWLSMRSQGFLVSNNRR